MDDLSKELEDEKREFEENLDKDSDGRLDREEVKRWAVPSLPGDVEYFEDEADHLIHVADKNEVCGNSSYNTINDHVSIIIIIMQWNFSIILDRLGTENKVS